MQHCMRVARWKKSWSAVLGVLFPSCKLPLLLCTEINIKEGEEEGVYFFGRNCAGFLDHHWGAIILPGCPLLHRAFQLSGAWRCHLSTCDKLKIIHSRAEQQIAVLTVGLYVRHPETALSALFLAVLKHSELHFWASKAHI